MRRAQIIKHCSAPGEDVVWARKGKREAIVYRKSLIYFAEKGLVADIRAAGGKLRSSDKLDKYLMLASRMEKGEDRTEGFVSGRKTTDGGIDALLIESLDGRKKWIDRNLTGNFAFSRKYWFDDGGWNNNVVLIEEKDIISGLVMTLDIADE